MRVGIVGLGRMGMNMARRLLKGGQKVVAYNRSPEPVKAIAKAGAVAALTLEELVAALPRPRVIWLMIPAGRPVDDMIGRLIPLLSKNDVIIDGGNSRYQDDIRRAEALGRSGLEYMDVGVSGGIWGLKNGYCLMVGGDKKLFSRLRPIFKALAPKEGFLHCGPVGSGHFVKMIHNGIEYGMMSAYGEGFALLEGSPYGKDLDLAGIAHLWNQGSVVRSWLLELAEQAFRKDPNLSALEAYVEDSGEGRWTVEEALRSAVPAPVISLSVFQRFRSRRPDSFSDKVLAALRNEFGGHAVKKSAKKRSTSR